MQICDTAALCIEQVLLRESGVVGRDDVRARDDVRRVELRGRPELLAIGDKSTKHRAILTQRHPERGAGAANVGKRNSARLAGAVHLIRGNVLDLNNLLTMHQSIMSIARLYLPRLTHLFCQRGRRLQSPVRVSPALRRQRRD